MMKTTSVLNNERGALMIIISVKLLALLTMISVTASRTANTEISIAGNEYAYQRCFYHAEGAVVEAVDRLEGGLNPMTAPPSWMSLDENMINDANVFSYWKNSSKMKGATYGLK